MVIVAALLLMQGATDSMSAEALPGWAAGADSSTKLVTSVVAALVGLFGIPVAYLQTQKTRVEIRKLELEARALEQKNVPLDTLLGSHSVVIENTYDSRINVEILADPRFLGPLLVLLDFIVVWVLLTFASYGLGVFLRDAINNLVIAMLSALLLLPVLRNAIRIRGTLRAAYPARESPDHSKEIAPKP